MGNRRSIAQVILAAALLAPSACKKSGSGTDPAQPQPQPQANSDKGPLGFEVFPSLDAKTAFANVERDLVEAEKMLADKPPLEAFARLVNFNLLQAQYQGKISALEKSIAFSDRALREYRNDPAAHLTRAQLEAEVRRFDRASAELAEAEKLGGVSDTVIGTRLRIQIGRGMYKEALETLRRHNEEQPDFFSLGSEAIVWGELGEDEKAEQAFTRAHQLRRDNSPFPLAWLYNRAGRAFEKAGDVKRARKFYEASLVHVPQYGRAAANLGPLLAAAGETEAAIKLLRPLAETSEDPLSAGVLARILSDAGKADDAEKWRALAAQRFDDAMSKFPEMFADVAVEFWLHTGRDPKKALAAAEKDFEARVNAAGFPAAIDAALAAGDTAAACRFADGALAARLAKRPFETVKPHAVAAYEACGKADQAAGLRAAADQPRKQ